MISADEARQIQKDYYKSKEYEKDMRFVSEFLTKAEKEIIKVAKKNKTSCWVQFRKFFGEINSNIVYEVSYALHKKGYRVSTTHSPDMLGLRISWEEVNDRCE